MKKALIGVVLAMAAVGAIVSCRSCDGEGLFHRQPLTEAEEMERMIERLADVHKKPITIGGEAVVYRPKEDKTVTQEILNKGFDAVPALIKGLHHKREDVREQCAALLSELPRRSGVEALIQNIGREDAIPVFKRELHISLHLLTGLSQFSPPGGVTKPDVEGIKKIWLPWWAANKDKLVDTDTGISLKNDDGTITPLPLDKK